MNITNIKINNKFLNCSVFLLSITLLLACSSSPKEPTAQIFEKKPNDTVELNKNQIEVVGLKIGSIIQQNMSEMIKANGQLMVPPESKAAVNALVGGIVRKIRVKEGIIVREGQVVAYIENPEFIRMQQEYLTTKSNLVYIKQEFERQKRLNDQNAGTGKIFQQALSNYLSEQAKLNSLIKQLQQINVSISALNNGTITTLIPVLSPISGQVTHIFINKGLFADMNKTLMEVVDNSAVYCDLKIFQKDVAIVRPGQQIFFQFSGTDPKIFKGRIKSINKEYETDNRVVIAHADIDRPTESNLIAGTYVSASVAIGSKNVMAVPLDAVVNAEGKEFIFVALPENAVTDKNQLEEQRFVKTEVVTGLSDLGYIEIKLLKALPSDTRIVTKGARYVLAQSQGRQSDDE